MSNQNPAFKEGDVVVLKSGGPWMTVNEVYNNNQYVKCIWFNQNQVLQEQSFNDTVIKIADQGTI